ncbi:MAG: hypothetical protein HC942_02370 [Microcoleus sp. SU_5_6]|nr:hypothetical protein [Microcoleus sp. SU_5_6]
MGEWGMGNGELVIGNWLREVKAVIGVSATQASQIIVIVDIYESTITITYFSGQIFRYC